MAEKKVSIITVNLNNADGLLTTIKSVVEQTNRNFEFIIIDGASSDKSQQVIEQYKDDFTYSVSEKDTGIYHAMNKGITKANGEYLLFLNSGDWLNNEQVIENILPYLNNFDVISGDIDIFDNNQWHSMQSENEITTHLFLRISLYHQATFISKRLFETYGLYDESFRSTGDYEFFIRTLLKNNATYSHAPFKISNFVANGISNNSDFMAINLVERERSWENNFSSIIINEIKAYYKLVNSEELKWGRRVNKLIPF